MKGKWKHNNDFDVNGGDDNDNYEIVDVTHNCDDKDKDKDNDNIYKKIKARIHKLSLPHYF